MGPQRAAVCSAAAYESEDALSRDESQRDALRRFLPRRLILNTKSIPTLCWLRRKATADKTKQNWKRLCPSLWIKWHFALLNPLLLRRSHDLHVCKSWRKFVWKGSDSPQILCLSHSCTFLHQTVGFEWWPWKQSDVIFRESTNENYSSQNVWLNVFTILYCVSEIFVLNWEDLRTLMIWPFPVRKHRAAVGRKTPF